MVFGKQVTVLYEKLDKYGRVVGKVLVDGKDVNLEQLRAGMGWFYRFYEKELSREDRLDYAAARPRRGRHARGFGRILRRSPPGTSAGQVKRLQTGRRGPRRHQVFRLQVAASSTVTSDR